MFDVLQEFAHHHLVGLPNTRDMFWPQVGAFFDFRQSGFQVAQLLFSLFVSLGGQQLSHKITSTTPLGRLLLSVANWRSAHASKSASSAATMTCKNGQTNSLESKSRACRG